MLSVKDMEENDFNFSDCKRVGPEAYERLLANGCKPLLNDVVVAKDGSYLKTAFPIKEDREIALLSSIAILRPNTDIVNPGYLSYFLKSETVYQTVSLNYISGTALKRIILKGIKKIPISLPDIREQSYRVSLLDSTRKVIDQRKKQLELFDELIKARFVELFGNENNSRGWNTVNVEEVADVQVGVVIKPAQYYTDEDNGIKAFRSLNIGAGYIKDNDWVYFSQEGHQKNSKSILKEDDLLIVRSGAPGTACVVSKEYEGCNAIDVIIAHPDSEKVNPHYLCAFTNMPHGKKQIEEGTGGAAQQHFNVGKYNKMKLILPPMEKQLEYVDFLKQVDKSKVAVKKSLDESQKLFDSLMQEYFG